MTEANAASREARAVIAEQLTAALVAKDVGRWNAVAFVNRHEIIAALADEAASQPREGARELLARIICACDNDGLETAFVPENAGFFEYWLAEDVEYYRASDRVLAALHDTAPTVQAQGGGEVEPDLQLFEQVASGQIDPRYSRSSLAGAVKRIRAALAQSNPTDGGMAL